MPNENEVDKFNVNKYLSEEDLYQMACKRVKVKRDFITHLGTYCVVNGGLVALGLVIMHTMIPAFLSIFGWGIGLGCHYVDTVAKLKIDYKSSAVEKEMEFLKKNLDRDRNI